MRVLLAGVKSLRGVKDGKEWGPFTVACVLEGIEDKVSSTLNVMGHGYQAIEYDVADGLISEFKSIPRFPAVVDLQLATRTTFSGGKRIQVAYIAGVSIPQPLQVPKAA